MASDDELLVEMAHLHRNVGEHFPDARLTVQHDGEESEPLLFHSGPGKAVGLNGLRRNFLPIEVPLELGRAEDANQERAPEEGGVRHDYDRLWLYDGLLNHHLTELPPDPILTALMLPGDLGQGLAVLNILVPDLFLKPFFTLLTPESSPTNQALVSLFSILSAVFLGI